MNLFQTTKLAILPLALLLLISGCEKSSTTPKDVDDTSLNSIELVKAGKGFTKILRFEQSSGAYAGPIYPEDLTMDANNYYLSYFSDQMMKKYFKVTVSKSNPAQQTYAYMNFVDKPSYLLMDSHGFIPESSTFLRLFHESSFYYTDGDVESAPMQAYSRQGGFGRSGQLRMFLQGGPQGSNWGKFGLVNLQGDVRKYQVTKGNAILQLHSGTFEPISATEGILTELTPDSIIIQSVDLNASSNENPLVIQGFALNEKIKDPWVQSSACSIQYAGQPNEYISSFTVRLMDSALMSQNINTYYLHYIVKFNSATRSAQLLKQGVRYEESEASLIRSGVIDDQGNTYSIGTSGENGTTFNLMKTSVTGSTSTAASDIFTQSSDYLLSCIGGKIYLLVGRGVNSLGDECVKELELYQYNP